MHPFGFYLSAPFQGKALLLECDLVVSFESRLVGGVSCLTLILHLAIKTLARGSYTILSLGRELQSLALTWRACFSTPPLEGSGGSEIDSEAFWRYL